MEPFFPCKLFLCLYVWVCVCGVDIFVFFMCSFYIQLLTPPYSELIWNQPCDHQWTHGLTRSLNLKWKTTKLRCFFLTGKLLCECEVNREYLIRICPSSVCVCVCVCCSSFFFILMKRRRWNMRGAPVGFVNALKWTGREDMTDMRHTQIHHMLRSTLSWIQSSTCTLEDEEPRPDHLNSLFLFKEDQLSHCIHCPIITRDTVMD